MVAMGPLTIWDRSTIRYPWSGPGMLPPRVRDGDRSPGRPVDEGAPKVLEPSGR